MEEGIEQETAMEESLHPLEIHIEKNSPFQVDFVNDVFSKAVAIPGLLKVDIDDFIDTSQGTIIAEALRGIAQNFPGNFDINSDNLSVTTSKFLKYLSPSKYSLENPDCTSQGEWVWEENEDIKKAVIDALLYKAGLEAKAAGKLQNIAVIDQARKLLRLPENQVFADCYQGTSSTVLSGIEEAKGIVFSLLKLKEAGIARRTGEGFKGGASLQSIHDGISVGKAFEIGDFYAQVASTYYHRFPDKEREEIASEKKELLALQEELAKPGGYEGPYQDPQGYLQSRREKIQFWEEELNVLEAQPPGVEERTPFPIVFGLKGLIPVRSEDFYSSFKVGHEIQLRSNLKTMYVPMEQMGSIEEWRQKLDLAGVDIYPLEAVRLLRNINPDYQRLRKLLIGQLAGVKSNFGRDVS